MKKFSLSEQRLVYFDEVYRGVESGTESREGESKNRVVTDNHGNEITVDLKFRRNDGKEYFWNFAGNQGSPYAIERREVTTSSGKKALIQLWNDEAIFQYKKGTRKEFLAKSKIPLEEWQKTFEQMVIARGGILVSADKIYVPKSTWKGYENYWGYTYDYVIPGGSKEVYLGMYVFPTAQHIEGENLELGKDFEQKLGVSDSLGFLVGNLMKFPKGG